MTGTGSHVPPCGDAKDNEKPKKKSLVGNGSVPGKSNRVQDSHVTQPRSWGDVKVKKKKKRSLQRPCEGADIADIISRMDNRYNSFLMKTTGVQLVEKTKMSRTSKIKLMFILGKKKQEIRDGNFPYFWIIRWW